MMGIGARCVERRFTRQNVAGWPGGRNWIDSSSLMMRGCTHTRLIDDTDEMKSPKDDDDQDDGTERQ